MKFKLNPLLQTALFLSILSLLALAFNWRLQVGLHLLVALGGSFLSFGFWSLVLRAKKNPVNTLITALIVFLVLNYGFETADLYLTALASVLAVTWKFTIKHKGSPILNPAVAGLVLAFFLSKVIPELNTPVITWWGASFRQPVSLILLLAWMLVGLHRWRKWPVVLSFFLVHALVLVLRGEGLDFVKYTFLEDSTVYFMAAIMLVDPRTSPVTYEKQTFYGLVAALAYNIFLQYGIAPAELYAILAGNGVHFLSKGRRKKKLASKT